MIKMTKALILLTLTATLLSAATAFNFNNVPVTNDANGQPVITIEVPTASATSDLLASNVTVYGAITAPSITVTNRTAGYQVLSNVAVAGFINITNVDGRTNRILGTTILSSNTALEQPQYIDLVVSGMSLGAGGGAPAYTLVTGSDTGYMGYDTTDFAYCNVQMPHNIAVTNEAYPNIVIHPHIHWSPLANINVAAGSNITWYISWTMTSLLGTNRMSGSNNMTINVSGLMTNAGYQGIIEFEFTNNAVKLSDDLRMKVGRIPTPTLGQDVSGRVGLDYIDLHLPVGNKTILGSRQEVTQ